MTTFKPMTPEQAEALADKTLEGMTEGFKRACRPDIIARLTGRGADAPVDGPGFRAMREQWQRDALELSSMIRNIEARIGGTGPDRVIFDGEEYDLTDRREREAAIDAMSQSKESLRRSQAALSQVSRHTEHPGNEGYDLVPVGGLLIRMRRPR